MENTLVFKKGNKSIQWEKKIFSPNCAEPTECLKRGKNNLNHYLTSYVDTNFKWVIDLNMKVKTKTTEERTFYNLQKGKAL